jgi:hypothetical protein
MLSAPCFVKMPLVDVSGKKVECRFGTYDVTKDIEPTGIGAQMPS